MRPCFFARKLPHPDWNGQAGIGLMLLAVSFKAPVRASIGAYFDLPLTDNRTSANSAKPAPQGLSVT